MFPLLSFILSKDVRPFVKVVDNIVASLGSTVQGEFDGAVLGGMTDKLLQLRRDVNELLPPEKISVMSRDADEWSRTQKEMITGRRDIAHQRLKAESETEDYSDLIREA